MEKKIFIGEDDTAIVGCPECGRKTRKSVSGMKEIDRCIRLKCRCSCGHVFTALLERRKYFRKSVSLPGLFFFRDRPEIRYDMVVKDISRSGVKFEPDDEIELKTGDEIGLEFHLDDRHETMIKKTVIVKTVRGNRVGTEFLSRDMTNPFDKAYELAIGFYTFQK